LNIVMASDIHLGRNIGTRGLEKIVGMMNRLKPDLVLLPGDILDENVSTLPENNFSAPLQKIVAKYGVFAVTGNHEYYAGIKAAIASLRRGNVTVLEDTAVKIADAFYLIGRKDRAAMRFGEGRQSLRDITKGVDPAYPLILMDHQPFHLEESQQNGIDLQVSGHTHNGQMFPFNLITKRVYEIAWGYLRKGNTQYYVSCGVGTWGPPVRLGNVPEIVQIKVTFK